jgi:hypothetical protein
MKWLVIGFLAIFLIVSAQSKCIVSDFHGLSWTNNPTERHLKLSEWLTKNGNFCSSEQLIFIWNHLAEWAGVADSIELRQKIIYYLNIKEQQKK